MRVAIEMARQTLDVFLGREPTLEEQEQIPPLYEMPVTPVPLRKVVSSEDESDE